MPAELQPSGAVTAETIGPSRLESLTDVENAPYRREIEVKLFTGGLGTDVADTDDLIQVGEMLLARPRRNYACALCHRTTGRMRSKRILDFHSARHGSKTLLLLNQ